MRKNKGVQLSGEQQGILDAIIGSTSNACIIGAAGTGKSVLIHALKDEFENRGEAVVLCAPTGVAAENIGGVTIHNLLSLPVGICFTPKGKVMSHTPKGFRYATIMIVDEISMVRIDMIDAIKASLDKIKKKFEKKIRLIVVGDFFQLPPILEEESGEKAFLENYYGMKLVHPYAFLSPSWSAFGFEYYTLSNVMRQEDSGFSSVLNKIRIGDKKVLPYINEHYYKEPFTDAITIRLRNKDVMRENNNHLSRIQGKYYIIEPLFMGKYDSNDIAIYTKELRLKIGARVMITANDTRAVKYDFIDTGDGIRRRKYNSNFVNGSIATVVDVSLNDEDSTKDSVILMLYKFRSRRPRFTEF